MKDRSNYNNIIVRSRSLDLFCFVLFSRTAYVRTESSENRNTFYLRVRIIRRTYIGGLTGVDISPLLFRRRNIWKERLVRYATLADDDAQLCFVPY